jgi:hypothetical protein
MFFRCFAGRSFSRAPFESVLLLLLRFRSLFRLVEMIVSECRSIGILDRQCFLGSADGKGSDSSRDLHSVRDDLDLAGRTAGRISSFRIFMVWRLGFRAGSAALLWHLSHQGDVGRGTTTLLSCSRFRRAGVGADAPARWSSRVALSASRIPDDARVTLRVHGAFQIYIFSISRLLLQHR